MNKPKQVSSLQNPAIKLLRSLEMRKARTETGLFIAEGLKLILMAKEQGWIPTLILFEQGNDSPLVGDAVAWGLEVQAECLEVPLDILSKLSTKDNPQSVIGVFKQKFSTVEALTTKPNLLVALEEVRDPGNLGTIIRTCDAVQADGILLIGKCCDPWSREAVRASMGSIFSIPLAKIEPEEFAHVMQGWKGETIGTYLPGSVDFRRAYPAPTLLIMGSEGPGLSQPIAQKCSRLVKIPMQGHADSLNLGIATSLMLYEIRRTNLTN
jgi:TrmH family RNA methyltransferase